MTTYVLMVFSSWISLEVNLEIYIFFKVGRRTLGCVSHAFSSSDPMISEIFNAKQKQNTGLNQSDTVYLRLYAPKYHNVTQLSGDHL